MLLAIPLGYFVAAFLMVTGVVNCKEYLQNIPEGTNYTEVLNGVVQAGWPLIAAVVILLLIQVCQQIERLRLVASYTPAPAETDKKARKKKHTEESPAESSAAPQQPQRYPNSPIPGAASASSAAHQTVSPAGAARTAPGKPQTGTPGLNYFKVD